LDPTHHQYGHEEAVDQFQLYLDNKANGADIREHAFGTSYKMHFDKYCNLKEDEWPEYNFDLFLLQAGIMTINNSVHKALERNAGPEALLSMNDADFEAAKHEIINSLHNDLVELREEMDHMLFVGEDLSYQGLNNLVRVRNCEGHAICEAALDEMFKRT
jgi:hypothetical protein